MNIGTLTIIFVLLLVAVGWYLFLLEEYEKQLLTNDNTVLAALKAMNKHIVKDIGVRVVKFLLFGPVVLWHSPKPVDTFHSAV